MGEGLLPGEDVLAEHVRLGSQAVILSRTFHNSENADELEFAIGRLRTEELRLTQRSAADAERDRVRIGQAIKEIARGIAGSRGAA